MSAEIFHIRDYQRPEERQAAIEAVCLDAVDRSLFDDQPLVRTDGQSFFFGGDESA